MMLMQIVTRGVYSVTNRGVWRSIQCLLGVVEDVCFDGYHRLDTGGIVPLADLDISTEDKQHCQYYQPTRIRHFRKLMRTLNLPASHVFVDVGCGKGRIVIAAAQIGFCRVVGIEISPQLAAIATRNVGRFEQRCNPASEMEIVQSNVTDFQLCHDETIFYLFYPFDRSLTEQFLAKVRASLDVAPREIWLALNNFQYADLLTDDSAFTFHSHFTYGGSEFDVYRHRPTGQK